MSKRQRLLLVGFIEQTFYQQVAEKLGQHYTSDLVYCSHISSKAPVHFADMDIIDSHLLHRTDSICDAFSSPHRKPLDESILKNFRDCKILFNRTLDRVFVHPISQQEQERYFNTLLAYWIGYLEYSDDISAVFYTSAPHFPWDIVLFFAARFHQIPVRFVRTSPIDDCVLLSYDLQHNDPCIVKFSPEMAFLAPAIQLSHLRRQGSATLAESRKSNRQFLARGAVLRRARAWGELIGRAILSMVSAERRLERSRHYFRLSAISLVYNRVIQELRVRRFRSWLRRNSATGPLHRPYIYFALHSQPERTTDPEAGWFSDQILALELLSSALPDGWTIIVKEHPRQVGVTPADLRQRNFRSVRYYERLSAIPGVTIVSPWQSSSELIEHCEMVVSCTGSVLWEGLLQGRPGVSFGPTWHSACRSTPVVTTLSALRQEISRLVDLTPEDVYRDLEGFLRESRYSLVRSAGNTDQARRSRTQGDVLATNAAACLVESLAGEFD